MRIEEVHIDLVKVGDVILHEGEEKTLSKSFLKRDKFMGTSIWGDSYRSGTKTVKRVIYEITS